MKKNRKLFLFLTLGMLGCGAYSGEFSADFSAAGKELTVSGSPGTLTVADGSAVYQASRADSTKYRFGAIELNRLLGGDVEAECRFDIEAFDHWNSFTLNLRSAQKGLWSASLSRVQEAPGVQYVCATVTVDGQKRTKRLEQAPSAGIFAMEKRGTTVKFFFRQNGETTEIASFDGVPDTACRLGMNFETPPATDQKVTVSSLKAVWSNDNPVAFPPPFKSAGWSSSDRGKKYACETVADFSAGKPAWNLAGVSGALVNTGEYLLWDAARAVQQNGHRWGAADPNLFFGGDFIVEADFDIKALDHWNGTRLSVLSREKDEWSVMLSRSQTKPGEEYFSVIFSKNGKTVGEKKAASNARIFTLRIERRGDRIFCGWRDAEGKYTELASFGDVPQSAARTCINFDSPAGTAGTVCVTGLRLKYNESIPAAFCPFYKPHARTGDTVVLFSENAGRDEKGVWEIAPGGRLIMAARCAPVSRSWALRYQSQGALKIRAVVPGSAESIQLSDTVQWDNPETAASLKEFKERACDLENYTLRFPGERRWPLSHVTINGLFFFEVSPSGAEAVKFASPELWANELAAPEPFRAAEKVTASGEFDENGFARLKWPVPASASGFLTGADIVPSAAGGVCDGVPYLYNTTILSRKCPSVELDIDRYAGMVHILHVAGMQGKVYSEIAAAYLMVYSDGTTEPAFATLRWNCGVYAAGDYDKAGFMTTGPGQDSASTTWWGPPRFGWANVLRLPRPPYMCSWNAFYSFTLLNPRPEKKIRSIIAYQMPGDTREFALVGITLRAPEKSVVALVEPDSAAISDGETGVNVYEYRSVPAASSVEQLTLEKSAGATEKLGEVAITRNGALGGGRTVVGISSEKLDAGPAVFRAGDAVSSRISLMGKDSPADSPFYYMMIAGGHEGFGDFERLRRLGFDAVKVHIPWELDKNGNPDFSVWPSRFALIDKAGLKVAIRNLFVVPKEYRDRIPVTHQLQDGVRSENPDVFDYDTSNAFYREKLVDYYRRVGELAAAAPNVIGINANYGQRNRIGELRLIYSDTLLKQLGDYLSRNMDIAEFNRRTGLNLKNFGEITPEMIWNDRSRTLFPAYSRINEEVGNRLIEDIAAAIRSTGCKAHLTFNVNFHPVEHKLTGQTFGEYLRIGVKYPPASLFHESVERYNISFLKWLAAGRTFGLPYGDEVCQPPPTYEHAVLGYMWMGMFQCYESNYCQWWGGKPATQNLAQLKAYHKLMYNAKYLPDPVTLSLSLETGHEETPQTTLLPLHTRTFSHYGLANFLRELNINADRYMIDEFPEKDAEVKSRLLIDDHTRYMPREFGDRIEKFIRGGGVYLASFDTDSLNDFAFFRRFGISVKDGAVQGARVTRGVYTIAEKEIGKGKLVILHGSWAGGWDPGRTPEQRSFMLNLLCRLGGFRPLVSSSFPLAFVTPYRAQNGDLLISCINIASEAKEVEIGFAESLCKGVPAVRDLGTGEMLPVRRKDGRYVVSTAVPELNTTVLRVVGR